MSKGDHLSKACAVLLGAVLIILIFGGAIGIPVLLYMLGVRF
jgi:hypothetical protein